MEKIYINFKEFTKDDVPIYYDWAERPHVKEKWFKDGYEPKEKILDKINASSGLAVPFVIEINDKKVGYIQYYYLSDGCWSALSDLAKETVGFDIFIGEEEYVGKGYGNKVVKAFTDKLLALSGIKRVIVDPFADDKRAIRCYEKAGFSYIKKDKDDKGAEIYIMELKNE